MHRFKISTEKSNIESKLESLLIVFEPLREGAKHGTCSNSGDSPVHREIAPYGSLEKKERPFENKGELFKSKERPFESGRGSEDMGPTEKIGPSLKEANFANQQYFSLKSRIHREMLVNSNEEEEKQEKKLGMADARSQTDLSHNEQDNKTQAPASKPQDNQPAPDNQEIIIKCSLEEMSQVFSRESYIALYDSSDSTDNISRIEALDKIRPTKLFVSCDKAFEEIKNSKTVCHLIICTSDVNEPMVAKAFTLMAVPFIYIFHYNVDSAREQFKNWLSKIRCVDSLFENIITKIRQTVMTTHKLDFPAFAPIFNDYNKSEIDHLHLYIQGFTRFNSRPQAKADFLDLARSISADNLSICDFEVNYNDYSMGQILHWYTKECFLYKITNNCLRIATPDSIQYCRLILKDLEIAIKHQYKQKSKNYSGLLYRGAYISNEEWRTLAQNVGKDIEMYGFLSTSKNKKVALEFALSDSQKKALITIILPPAPDKGDQGYAEVNEFSEFKEEEEVLFNVMSTFTVVEVTIEKIQGKSFRHLILLYGAGPMKQYIKTNNPCVEVTLNGTLGKSCKACGLGLQKEDGFLVDLEDQSLLLSIECLKKNPTKLKFPMLMVDMKDFLQETQFNKKIPGIFMKYEDDYLDLEFYGMRCETCKQRPSNFCFHDIIKQEVYCYECLIMKKNEKSEQQKLVVMESYPYTVWLQAISNKEFLRSDYQKKELEGCLNSICLQAEIFLRTHLYSKAVEYCEKSLAQQRESNRANAATIYTNIGLAYHSQGDFSKAVDYHLKSLDIRMAVLGPKHPDTAVSYHNIGRGYYFQGAYSKAIECYLKSLEIRLETLGEKNSQAAFSYNNIGLAYHSQGEYSKAIEYHSKSLGIRLEVLGEKHPETAFSYNNIGSVYNSQGDYSKAIEFHSKALEVRVAILGEKHPDTATSYNKNGIVYHNLGNYTKAIQFYLRALEIRLAVLGEKHPDTASSYNNIGNVYGDQGDYSKAIEYHEKSLAIRLAVLGEKHPDTARSYLNIGVIYYNYGYYDKAVEYYMKSLKIRVAVLGEKHPETVKTNELLQKAMNPYFFILSYL